MGNIKQIEASCYYCDCSLLRNTEVTRYKSHFVKRQYLSFIRGYQHLYLLQLIHKENIKFCHISIHKHNGRGLEDLYIKTALLSL